MNSTPNPIATKPNDSWAARADERLAHAYEQIARADDQLARLTEKLSNLEQNAARGPSAMPARRPSRGRPALRGLIGLLLAASILAAAFVWQSSYGDVAKRIVRWAPQLIPTSSGLLDSRGFPAQPSLPGGQVAAAEPAPPQPTSPAQIPPKDVAPTSASMSPELAQLLQTMARDLADVGQGIAQLKASQEQLAQMTSDNAKAVEQLKAGQEQMTRLVAKASVSSEQNLRPQPLIPSPRPIAAPARKPVPIRPSP